MKHWGDKPYYSLDWYLKQTFGSKTYKVALDAGFTCPNRDGRVGSGGCIFCSAGGSGDFAGDRRLSIDEQLEHGIKGLTKFHANQYIAYYQAFTNTYADADTLRRLYEPALRRSDIAALSVATRPDCIPDETLELLSECSKIKPMWIELGLQTVHEKTARYIRRGYELKCFEETCKRLKEKKLPVIVHVILGLPGEDESMMLETIDYINNVSADGIKLQLLHVLENTDLAADYRAGLFKTLSCEEYVDITVKCIAELSQSIVIHRLTGDGPSDILIAPTWSREKLTVLNKIHHELRIRGIWQGCNVPKSSHFSQKDEWT